MEGQQRESLLEQAFTQVDRCVGYHRRSKHIEAGMAVGIVTQTGLTYGKAWGVTDVTASTLTQVQATIDHVFRVGSISKLFTDIAVMRLVEVGKLDLDEPITTYVPSFNPKSSYNAPVTLRNLMSHHSGLPREPLRGNYVDDSETSLEATINSLNKMSLVLEPNTKYKYSNAGIGLVGRVLEVTTGETFAVHVQKLLCDLDMKKTSFIPQPHLLVDLCHGYMWSYEDTREQVAPMFELGEAPAGTMFSTVRDMANFVELLVNGGTFREKHIIDQKTLQEMWREQFSDVPMGLGFVSKVKDGVRMVGHGGAIYGYSAELVVIPELKLGIISMLGLDACNPILSHINSVALRSLVPIFKSTLPETYAPPSLCPVIFSDPPEIPFPAKLRSQFEGLYVQAKRLDSQLKMSRDDSIAPNNDSRAWIYFFATKLHLQVLYNHMRVNVRVIPHQVPASKIAPGLEVLRVTPDDRLMCGCEDSVYFDIFYDPETARVDHMVHLGDIYKRSSETTLTPKMSRKAINHEPSTLAPYVGEYGPPHNPTFVFIRENQLVVQVEWFCISVVQKIATDCFKFEDTDLYSYETVRFERDLAVGPDAPAIAIILCDHLRYPRVAPRKYTKFER